MPQCNVNDDAPQNPPIEALTTGFVRTVIFIFVIMAAASPLIAVALLLLIGLLGS